MATALVLAFMIMASVFTPHRSPAAWPGWDPDLTTPSQRSKAGAPEDTSSDPHEGLQMLGSIEGARYRVEVYATDVGPRYSVYDVLTGVELGALLSAEQVERYYPELGLPSMEFDTDALMVADTPQ